MDTNGSGATEDTADESWPNEQDYLDQLERERTMFAWTLEHYGHISGEDAKAAALECYPFQPCGTYGRGLVFHDHAWHWAMLTIHKAPYWQTNPELESVPKAYRDEEERIVMLLKKRNLA